MKKSSHGEVNHALIHQLLRLNPKVAYARIGREVGCTGQTVGNIARSLGLPSRKGGGFDQRDETELVYPQVKPEAPSEGAANGA